MAGDASLLGDVVEGAVALIAEQAVAVARRCRTGGERAPLDHIDIEPAIAVVVEQTDAAAGRCGGDQASGLPAVLVDEPEAGCRGVVDEPGRGPGRERGRRANRRRSLGDWSASPGAGRPACAAALSSAGTNRGGAGAVWARSGSDVAAR